MQLKPSEIYFSQAEINSVFDRRSDHAFRNLGETLDDLVEGRCRISDIPMIGVMKRNGRWVTADNRRLWVFRHLEKLGKCSKIDVYETCRIDQRKLNSMNGGRTVRFYSGRYASGVWHRRVASIDPGEPTTERHTGLNTMTNSMFSRPTFSSFTGVQQSRQIPSTPSFFSTEYRSRPTSTNVFSGNQTESLASSMRSMDLTNENVHPELNPGDIRYTKESVNINDFFKNLEFHLRMGLKNKNDVDPVIVYKAFGKHWVTDGNKRVWSFKEAQSSKIRADINEDKDEFLDVIRTERPWLSVFDILQSGESVQVV